MTDPDDHAAALEFDSTYDVMFYLGNPEDEAKDVGNSANVESTSVTKHETNHSQSQTVAMTTMQQSSSKSKMTEMKHISKSSRVSETKSVEMKEIKMQSKTEKTEQTVTYSNGPNTDNGRMSEDRNTSPSASVSNRSSRSPRSPASPITLSPQSPTHWSISARTSPSVSTGPSPRSTSPASPGSPVQITVTSEEIMEAYARQEKAFQEVFQNQASPMMLKTPPRTRSPSSSPSRKNMSVGIDHLDNLVRLMEQLSSLKEENTTLRKKCAYLEDTKTLLKVQNDMLLFRKELARSSKRVNAKPVRTRSKRLQKGHQSRPPLDMRSMSIIERRGSDSSLDELSLHMRDRSGSGKLSHRSQSVGSINVHDGTVDLDIDIKSKHGKRGLRDKKRIETVFSRSTITSKWNRVKKVFSGKPEISTKTEPTCATAEQLVKANTVGKTSKSNKEGSIGGSSSQESADSKIRPGGGSSTSGDFVPPSPSSQGYDANIPCLVADNQNIYEEIATTEHHALEAECNVVTTSRGSSFGSDESNHDTNKTATTTTTNSSKQQHLTTITREEKSLHHSTSSPSPQYLTVESQASLRPRRQSSPHPHMTWTAEDLELIEKIELEPPRSPRIGRSSSFKAAKRQNSLEVSSPGEERARTRSPDIRKSNRTAWGRVKDIIHTRKDSLKVKNKRSNSAGDMLPDASGFEDYHLNYDSPTSSTSQPSSPKPERRGSVKPPKSPRSSPPRKRMSPDAPESPSPLITRQDSIVIAGTQVDVSALMGGMSEEWTKKMQEWENKKRRSVFGKDSSICIDDDDKNSTKFDAEFIKKMEQWEKKKGYEQRPIPPAASRPRAETQSPPGGTTPTRELEGSQTQMDVLSESFSKTVQEWERIKTKRIKDGGSPTPERRGRRESRKSRRPDGRSKSRERDRSHNKYEKQKERERQKIEKKEKLLEKERLKLEKMKFKLEAVEILSEANVEGVTSDFERRLHEWEVMKGLKPSTSVLETKLKSSTSASQLNSLTVSHQRSSSAKEYKDSSEISHQRSNSAKDHKEQMALQRRSERERAVSEGADLSLHVPGGADFSPSSSTGCRSGAASPQVIDDSTSIDINITAETVAKLEAHNRKLLSEVSEKEDDLAALQDDVTQLTGRINEMNIDHNQKIEHYKRELWAASSLGRYTIETDLVAAGMNEVEKRLQQLHSNQRMLVAEKSHLQLQMKQLALAKQTAEARLVQELQSITSDKDSQNLESAEHILKIHSDFEKLCNFFLKIQNQLSELKLGLAERNQLLLDMQRHLINKEVTNRLLEANVQRKDLELQFYKERDHTGLLKRSKTFTGNDLIQRPEHLSGKRPKRYLPTQPSEDYEGTVKEMQSVALTEIEEAYWDWLERLKRQRAVLSGSRIPDVATDEVQTDVKSLDMKEVGAQTVMTLCNISYASPSGSPVARLSSIPSKVSVATSPDVPGKGSSKQHPLITKSKALEMAKSNSISSSADDIAKDRMNGKLIKNTESEADEKDGSITLAESPTRPPRRARLIRWKRKTSTDDSLSSQKSDDSNKPKDKANTDRATPPISTSSSSTPGWSSPSTPSSANKDSRAECTFTFSEEPKSKPPISPTRRKRSPGIRKAGSSSPEKPQSPTRMYSISVPYPQHDKSPNLPRAKDISVKGESDAKMYLAKLDDALNSGHEETYAEYKLRTSCAPHSPIIRSKYQRKIKAAESKASHNGDSRTWQATPPRRFIRHRKISSEKRPDISSLVEGDLSVNLGRIAQHDDHDQVWRNRALSDSHPALKKDSLSVPTDESGQYVFKYQKDQKQMPVSDVISRFERHSLHSSGEVFRKSPSPGAIGRPTVSPVRRLKTAEELLQEYSNQRRSSAGNNMDRLSPGRDKFPSTSSDKENDKTEKSVIKNSSGENTPERVKESRASPKQGKFVSQAIRRLSIPDIGDQKGPLQDMTNDSHKKEQAKSLQKTTDPRLKDLPRLGIVSKQAGLFQAKIGAESRQAKRQAPLPPGSDYGVRSNSSYKSSPDTSATSSPSFPGRTRRSPDKQMALYPPSTQAPTSSPQSSRAKGYSKFFARKVSPSAPSGAKGAVSALCKQAMFVEFDSKESRERGVLDRPASDHTAADQTASPERRRAKAKFLDSNWLQKPRRFFKVSKC